MFENCPEIFVFYTVKAKAGYNNSFSDPEFIAALPKFNIPTLPRHGTYRTFPISGDSMLPIPDGSEVTGRFLENWKEIKAGTPCIIILNGVNDFVFKLVTLQDNGTFLLESLNRVFAPYVVEPADVLEVWQFQMLHLKEMPEAITKLQELKMMFKDVMSKLGNKKSGIF